MRNRRRLEVADALHSASIRILRRLRQSDDATGITAPRLSALSVLVFAGPMTLGELAAAEGVRPPTMTRLVTALEAEGLVERQVVTEDRRKTIVRPTPRGRKVMVRGRGMRVRKLGELLSGLSASEMAEVERVATLMLRVAASDTTGGSSRPSAQRRMPGS